MITWFAFSSAHVLGLALFTDIKSALAATKHDPSLTESVQTQYIIDITAMGWSPDGVLPCVKHEHSNVCGQEYTIQCKSPHRVSVTLTDYH